MGKTRGQEYLEKFADQPIRFTPCAVRASRNCCGSFT